MRAGPGNGEVRDREVRGGRLVSSVSNGRRLVASVLAGLVTFLLGAAAIAEPVRDWTLWKLSGSPPLTCQNPAWLEPAALINARAASNLRRDDGIDYFPGNTVDGQMSTAWVSRRTSNELWVSWDLERPVDVLLICVTPGYAKSPDRFTNQQQLREVQISLNDATHTFRIPQFNEDEYQKFYSGRAYCPDCQEIVLTIRDTFPARNGDPEVAVSEVVVYADPRVPLLRRLLPER